ncbi:MAG: Lrp/AsnC family transcriptional regulator [Candidatus Micrarchaeia archaeon]
MDRRDMIILRALVDNARVSYVELARRLCITEAAVRKRVKRLEVEGVVQRYTAVVEPVLLGFAAVAVVGVDTRPDALLQTHEALKRIKNVRYSALSTGDHMLLFEAWCRDQAELGRLVRRVARMPGVTRVCPAVLMKRREMAE